MAEAKKTDTDSMKSWKWWAWALAFPLGFKKLGVWLTAWFLAWPLGMTFFPRAEKVLKDEGLDPALVEQLAPGKKIYVRTEDTLGGKIHAYLSKGPIGVPVAMLMGKNVWGYQEPTLYGHLGLCEIFMKTSAFEDLPRTTYQRVLLHEIRHCSDENVKLRTAKLLSNVWAEGDADFKATVALAREKKDVELLKGFFIQRALRPGGDKDHDTALYIDAKLNDRPMPSIKEMNEAWELYNDVAADKRKERIDCGVRSHKKAENCTYYVDEQRLTGTTLRRFQIGFWRDLMLSKSLDRFIR